MTFDPVSIGCRDLQGGSSLSLSRLFYDEHWSKHRVITCLDWSPQYPELLVASYNNNEDAPHEPDGVALVWNMKFKKNTPEWRDGVAFGTSTTVRSQAGEVSEAWGGVPKILAPPT
ncbi:hypothetical protein DPEC_G00288290 [Dallia pectoralis]|uniref:Uncharacterized protein n=1 Tax=Dallia pectoralis TaxID=75939 RepID=A0ACC2FKV1_DALPE|nr:hypothetical protein DPEC_G00288290 [Dallia pectoralis]